MSGRRKHTIEEMQKIAGKRRGTCLSKVYTNLETKLTWRCSHGHIWEAKPKKVLMGLWCPFDSLSHRKRKK